MLTSTPLICHSTDLSFDLSPLTKDKGEYYTLKGDKYNYYINVCGTVKTAGCPETSGACQAEEKQGVAERWAGA